MTITPARLRGIANDDYVYLRHTHDDIWEALHDAADLIEEYQREFTKSLNEREEIQTERDQAREELTEIYYLFKASVYDERGGFRRGSAYFDEFDLKSLETLLGITPDDDGDEERGEG